MPATTVKPIDGRKKRIGLKAVNKIKIRGAAISFSLIKILTLWGLRYGYKQKHKILIVITVMNLTTLIIIQ